MNKLIGVFDSGIGGVAVLERLAKTYNDYKFIYYGDNDNAPYGDKSPDYIFTKAKECVEKLKTFGCTIIVVACNTVSLVCGEKLALYFSDIEFVFMKPYFVDKTENGVIFCTIATAKTLLNNGLATQGQVYPLPDMAKLIEDSFPNIKYKEFIRRFNNDFAYSKVILGCTHYIFLKRYFKNFFPVASIDDCVDRVINDLNLVLQKKDKTYCIDKNNYEEIKACDDVFNINNCKKEGDVTTERENKRSSLFGDENYKNVEFIGKNAYKNRKALWLLKVTKRQEWL